MVTLTSSGSLVNYPCYKISFKLHLKNIIINWRAKIKANICLGVFWNISDYLVSGKYSPSSSKFFPWQIMASKMNTILYEGALQLNIFTFTHTQIQTHRQTERQTHTWGGGLFQASLVLINLPSPPLVSYLPIHLSKSPSLFLLSPSNARVFGSLFLVRCFFLFPTTDPV